MSDGQPPARPGDDDESPDPANPFAGLPLFGDLAKALAGQGPLNWDAARQFALMGATGGTPESNVSPDQRFAYEDLSRIARMHVADIIGMSHELGAVRAVTRAQWATETLEAYRHLFTEMAASLGRAAETDDESVGSDPMMSMMAGLSRMMAPAMLGMSIGSMIGRLSTRAFGSHDLPIPRQPSTVTLVPANIDAFATESEIPLDEMRLWVLAHEIAGFTLFEAAHLRDALVRPRPPARRRIPTRCVLRHRQADVTRRRWIRPDRRPAAGAERPGTAARGRYVSGAA